MANVSVFNMEGNEVGTMELNDAIFGAKVNEHLVHLAMKNVLANLKADKALVILNDNDQNVVLSARNIEGVETALTNTINVFDLLKHNTVVVTKAAVETIEEVYA